MFKVRLSQNSNKTIWPLHHFLMSVIARNPAPPPGKSTTSDTNLCTALLTLLWPWLPPFFKAWNLLILFLEFPSNSWSPDKSSICFLEFPFCCSTRFWYSLEDSSHGNHFVFFVSQSGYCWGGDVLCSPLPLEVASLSNSMESTSFGSQITQWFTNSPLCYIVRLPSAGHPLSF